MIHRARVVVQAFVLALILLGSHLAVSAQVISDDTPGFLPLRSGQLPATDLYQPGLGDLSPEQARDLENKGTKLWTLNPDPNASRDLWTSIHPKNVNLTQANFADDRKLRISSGDTISYSSVVVSKVGNFRFAGFKNGNGEANSFTFLIGKTSHNVLLRKALLRKLGYRVPAIKRLSKVKVEFKSAFAKELFVNYIAENTAGVSSRWVIEGSSNGKNSLWLQDVIVMESNPTYYNLAMGTMQRGTIRGRRLLNALQIPFELVDNPESINLLSWEFGKIISERLQLSFRDAREFNGNYDDAKWISVSIAKLTHQDIVDIVATAELPLPVSKLLVEKIKSRRNSLLRHMKLRNPELRVNLTVSSTIDGLGGDLVLNDGKLLVENWPGYGSRFAYGDAESPLSQEELVAFGKSRVLSNVISNSLTEINSFFRNDVASLIREKQIENFNRQFVDFLNTGEVKKAPVRVDVVPVFGANLILSRDIVMGGYLGADNTVQLADAVGYQVYAGAQAVVHNLPVDWRAGGGARTNYGRTYTHLRPIKCSQVKDNKEGTSQGCIRNTLKYPFKNVFVNFLENEMGKVFNGMMTGEFHQLPEKEQMKQIESFMLHFKDKLQVGESLMIADSVGLGFDINARYTWAAPLVQDIRFGQDNRLILSRLHIYRKSDNTLQVYKSKGNVSSFFFSTSLRAHIPVLTFEARFLGNGKAQTKLYSLNIDHNPDSNSKLRPTANAIRSLFLTNSLELVEDVNKPIVYSHKFKESSTKIGLLFYRWAWLREKTCVTAQHPKAPEAIKKICRNARGYQQGKNFEQLTLDIVNAAIAEAGNTDISIGSPNNGRPGNTVKGSSYTRNVIVDGEIDIDKRSKQEELVLPYASIQHSWRGWKVSRRAAENILRGINRAHNYQFYPATTLHNVKNILLYTIILNYFISDEGISYMLSHSKAEVAKLFEVYGKPDLAVDDDNSDSIIDDVVLSPKAIFSDLLAKYKWAERRKLPKKQLDYVNQMIKLAERSLYKEGLMRMFGGTNNVLVTSQIQGFREGAESGFETFFSNTMGEVGRYPSGPMERLRNQIGATESEFFAYWLRERL